MHVLRDRFLFYVFLAKLGDLLFPDLAGMVNGVLSLFMWVLEWVFGLDFHGMILRRLSGSARWEGDCTCRGLRFGVEAHEMLDEPD